MQTPQPGAILNFPTHWIEKLKTLQPTKNIPSTISNTLGSTQELCKNDIIKLATLDEELIYNKSVFPEYKAQILKIRNQIATLQINDVSLLRKVKEYEESIPIIEYLISHTPTEKIPENQDTTRKILLIWQKHFTTSNIEAEKSDAIIRSQKYIYYYTKYFLPWEHIIWTELSQSSETNEKSNHIETYLSQFHKFLREKMHIDSEGNPIHPEESAKIERISQTGENIIFLWNTFTQEDPLYKKIIIAQYFWEKYFQENKDLEFLFWNEIKIIQNTPHRPKFIEPIDNQISENGNKIMEVIYETDDFLYKNQSLSRFSSKTQEEYEWELAKAFNNEHFKTSLLKGVEAAWEKLGFATNITFQWFIQKIQKLEKFITTKREENTINNIESIFPQQQRIVPIIFWASHLAGFEEVIKKHNQNKPNEHYALDIIDLWEIHITS